MLDSTATVTQHLLLGAHGDLIQMLPVWRELHRRTGQRPQVIVSEQFAGTLSGASYVEPLPLPVHWFRGMPEARRLYPNAVALSWWNDTALLPPPEVRGSFVLNHRGYLWRIDQNRIPSYGHAMMRQAGFVDESEWRNLPLVFDQRDAVREMELLTQVWTHRERPLLLYNFSGVSSPFGYVPEIWPLLQRFARDFTLLDLGRVRAHRIYDLLGLYGVAAGLLTCDSATLHLCPASRVPYVAFVQNGWVGSVPRGNCVLSVRYSDTLRRLDEVAALLAQWARAATQPVLVSSG